jgi:hypothetical protein
MGLIRNQRSCHSERSEESKIFVWEPSFPSEGPYLTTLLVTERVTLSQNRVKAKDFRFFVAPLLRMTGIGTREK